MDEREGIRIKPHHFVDILIDVGRGHTDWQPLSYGHAVHLVARRLLVERGVPIRVELGIDDICEPCVHHVGDACDDTVSRQFPGMPSSKMEWNLRIDGRWCKLLGLRQGQGLSAGQFCRMVREAVSLERMKSLYPEHPLEKVEERYRHLVAGLEIFCGEPADGRHETSGASG